MKGAERNGRLVMIVGPSGAGKDSLIDYARERLSDDQVHFVRRTVTRPPSPGEDHNPMTADDFKVAALHGAFALHWGAHGLYYGLPVTIDDLLRDNKVVVANGSRLILPAANSRYPRLQIVSVRADPKVLAARLKARGRETSKAQEARLARSAPAAVDIEGTFVIENSGDLSVAGNRLIDLLVSRSGETIRSQTPLR
ncbi:phosphonate metabolism protein/1,5-bisphosphokinase (PRPP-forming) PhnN [Rhizobium sp. 1AS11]|uniref:phosphonate metabolism protein/1,5-bisphosphokinase (PRPP-forming) PhnN n=1 Tax=Rhizobium acaciae TaxID=2989736 RepID=UPI0022218B8C|nr:phosphonate metabolism protein/1,5-bisphosphokinase (PRPP-forming) PhnN [Rhizobium acaciae]MCW1412981.1 phosphonate metabolism protein/1,5-bisphosphokinase (PRPP-forming) PhnN [Rhizobium acaciae]MCW1745133.1 phosphonate metabolism protein/1,5-bisphosphokinase (PRPP-forming) PhnN [Rhizobium acaciae]